MAKLLFYERDLAEERRVVLEEEPVIDEKCQPPQGVPPASGEISFPPENAHTATTATANTFETLFCTHCGVDPSDFQRKLLSKIFYRRWTMVALLLYLVGRRRLITDLDILRQLGRTTSKARFKVEVSHFRQDYRDGEDFGLFRRYLKFRLSGARAISLCEKIWPDLSAAQS